MKRPRPKDPKLTEKELRMLVYAALYVLELDPLGDGIEGQDRRALSRARLKLLDAADL